MFNQIYAFLNNRELPLTELQRHKKKKVCFYFLHVDNGKGGHFIWPPAST